MPFQSEAQRKLFYAKERRGEMKKGTAARWQRETGKKRLPKYKSKKRSKSRG